jgi:hypothetical protein
MVRIKWIVQENPLEGGFQVLDLRVSFLDGAQIPMERLEPLHSLMRPLETCALS